MFVQNDFDIVQVLEKPLMAHLSTVEGGEPRDSPVWFLWEEGMLWLFGLAVDSFVKRLKLEPRCAVGVVDFDLDRGLLKHVGIRGMTDINHVNQDRLLRFVGKYLGQNQAEWNPWFIENVVDPLDTMIQVIPKTIVAKDVSFFKNRMS